MAGPGTSRALLTVAILGLAYSLAAQPAAVFEPARSNFSIDVLPGVVIPLGNDADVFALGYRADLEFAFAVPPVPGLHWGFNLDVDYGPLSGTPQFMGAASLALHAAYELELAPRVRVGAKARAGYFLATRGGADAGVSFQPGFVDGGNPVATGSLTGRLLLTPTLTLNTEVGYRELFGMQSGVLVSLGAGIRFRSPQARLQDSSLRIDRVDVIPLFSALYKYYDTHPIGVVQVSNVSDETLHVTGVSFGVKEVMDFPKDVEFSRSLVPGETATVDLFALFNNRVLDITEDTPLSSETVVSYTVDGEAHQRARTSTFELLNRNALVWDDDRKLASFMTPKDPAVTVFARGVVQRLDAEVNDSLNKNVQLGMQLFDALGAHGLTYVVDPTTPFIEFYDSGAIDFVNFPRDTLRFRTGDCDDLVACYSSLLQNIGVATAFITGPGHIFMALDTGVAEGDFRSISPDRDELIFIAGQVWIPVEATLVGDSFLDAWRAGARRYREWRARGVDNLYVAGEAWETYQSVTLAANNWEPQLPALSAVEAAFVLDRDELVRRAIDEEATVVRDALRRNPDDLRLNNQLGAIMARFSEYDSAIEQFFRTLDLDGQYVPALANIGNVYFLQRRFSDALFYYQEVAGLRERWPPSQLNLAKAYYELENYELADSYYAAAVSLNPRYRERYRYLGSSDSGSRADEAGGPQVVWEYE